MTVAAIPNDSGYVLVDGKTGIPVSAGASVDVLGVPLSAWTIKSVPLPPMSRREQRDAIRLQCTYQLPFPVEDGWVRGTVDARDDGQVLTVVGTPRAGLPEAKMVVPLPLALLGLAWRAETPLTGVNLLVQLDATTVRTTTVIDERVVFMRAFPRTATAPGAADSLARDLRLSCQDVYGRGERRHVIPERTVLFGAVDDATATALAAAELGEIVRPELPAGDVLGIGLATLAGRRRRLRPWDVLRRDLDYQMAVRRGMVASCPFFVIFLFAWYYGELYQANQQLDATQGMMQALAPRYRQVLLVDQDVTAMESFQTAAGPGWNSADYWLQLQQICEKHRPYGMRLTSISGRLTGTISVTGQAVSYEGVNGYLEKVSAEPLLQDTQLSYSQARGGHVDFQFTCKIAPVAAAVAAAQAAQDAAGADTSTEAGQ